MGIFPCLFLDEITILSDGRVTTCCVDSLGANAYANIYQHSPEEVFRRFQSIRNMYIQDFNQIEKCKNCVKMQSHLGEKNSPFINFKPTPQELNQFVNGFERAKGRFVIELTAACNLKCVGCIQRHGKMKEARGQNLFIDIDYLKNWFMPIMQILRNVRLYNYGETFVHPGSYEFCHFFIKT